jgi:hypothetical protein
MAATDATPFLSEVKQRFPEKVIDIWFQDEARFGQKTRLTAVWAETGSRPTAIVQNRFGNAYIFGAVNPLTGAHVGLICSHCDSEMMSHHLHAISQSLAAQVHAVVIMDGAGWHKSAELVIPSNISVCHLPPYCPELNPVERLWLWLKERYLSLRVYPTTDDLMDAGTIAWNQIRAVDVQSICRTSATAA